MDVRANQHIVFNPHMGYPVVPFITHGYSCSQCVGAFMCVYVRHGRNWWLSTGESWLPIPEAKVPKEYVGKMLLLGP